MPDASHDLASLSPSALRCAEVISFVPYAMLMLLLLRSRAPVGWRTRPSAAAHLVDVLISRDYSMRLALTYMVNFLTKPGIVTRVSRNSRYSCTVSLVLETIVVNTDKCATLIISDVDVHSTITCRSYSVYAEIW